MKNIGFKAMLLVAAILSLASCSKLFDINKKGGVRIVAQVSQKDVVKALSDDSQDPTFLEAMELATKRHEENGGDFVTLFGEAFEEASKNQGNPGTRLASIFLYELKDKDINIHSSNDEVLNLLRQECNIVARRSYEIITSRLDCYCKKESSFFKKIKYNIVQQHETPDIIIIELPTDERIDWVRVRKLVQATAQLEFWETLDANELQSYFCEADSLLAVQLAEHRKEYFQEMMADEPTDEETAELAEIECAKKHPLLSKLQMINSNGACVGVAQREDIADINKMLAEAQEMNIFSRQLKLAWTKAPRISTSENGENVELYDLVALKKTHDNKCALGGEFITDARQDYDQNNQAEVAIQMNPEGVHIWKRFTGDNIGRQIAIVLDDMVYSYPVVNSEIPNGRLCISGGGMTIEEAQDLANVMKTGKLPAPTRIIEERFVEPNSDQ